VSANQLFKAFPPETWDITDTPTTNPYIQAFLKRVQQKGETAITSNDRFECMEIMWDFMATMFTLLRSCDSFKKTRIDTTHFNDKVLSIIQEIETSAQELDCAMTTFVSGTEEHSPTQIIARNEVLELLQAFKNSEWRLLQELIAAVDTSRTHLCRLLEAVRIVMVADGYNIGV
jgi:hypothetical protein